MKAKNIHIHTIANIGGGWFADFVRTKDYQLEIQITPRHNGGITNTILLENVSNDELRELASNILSKLPCDAEDANNE